MAITPMTPERRKQLEGYRDALIDAMAIDARSVTHSDKTVTFKSQAELKEAIDQIDRLLSGRRKTRIVKVYLRRGV